jgi:glutamyl-tRNA reductase
MKFLLTGLNHRTAPVEVRERIAFDERALPDALSHLRKQPGVREGMILSTCNRVEVSVAAEEGSDAEGAVETFLSETRSVDRAWVSPYLYKYDGPEAIRHLFRVASSLDSMVVGEPQILGQLKTAYAAAKEHGSVHSVLDLVMTRAFNVAKRVRSETEIGQNAVSVSYAAVELAREIFGTLRGKKVLVIGAGKMADSAVRHLRRGGVSDIIVTNRTRARAEVLAQECEGKVIDYDAFPEMLPQVDIVLASSGAPHYILNKDVMKMAMNRRRNQPMFLIDIAVPRNIDPTVNEVESVFLYDIDDLGRVVEQNRKGRQQVAQDAEDIIRVEVDRMVERLKTRGAAPAIVHLQEKLEGMRKAEMDRMRSKLGPLTAQQEEAIEALTRGLVNKIAHGPIAEIRKHSDDAQTLDVIRRAFKLGGEE